MAPPGIDLPLNASGTGIDFGRGTVSGIEELRNAALGRITNAITYDDPDYGIDVLEEAGKPTDANYAKQLGLRCCIAIQNDTRFATATTLTATQSNDGESVTASLVIQCEVVDNTTFSLAVLVANGTVKLVS